MGLHCSQSENNTLMVKQVIALQKIPYGQKMCRPPGCFRQTVQNANINVYTPDYL